MRRRHKITCAVLFLYHILSTAVSYIHNIFGCAEAKLLVPDWGNVLARRVTKAGGPDDKLMSESIISPSQGLRIWPQDAKCATAEPVVLPPLLWG